jgi:hypothetical protein
MDWSGNDWGNATGMSGTAILTTGGGPNFNFTPQTNGLYSINFNPGTLAYSIQLQWQSEDIGAVGRAGSASYDRSSTFTVLGSGSDIQSTADEFRYVYQTASGDTEMRARVAGVQNTDPWDKVGVMIRESAAAGSRYAGVFVTPANGVTFQWRTTTGGTTITTTTGGLTAPKWLRVVRSANTFRGFYSNDGMSWTQIGGTQNITMSTGATIGLALTSHKDGTLTTSTLDSVVIGPLNTPPTLAAIPAQTILAGQPLSVTNSATDNDLPPQTLLFSLPNPPAGASINATNGVFTWRPAIAQSPSTQTIAVVVSDGGVPRMSAMRDLVVTITRPAPATLGPAAITDGKFGFWVNGDAGPDYVVQASSDLISWLSVEASNSPALPFFWTATNSATASVQFYRVLLAP